MDGSIWAETILYDQGIPLRRSGHPTCLYSGKKCWDPTWGHKTKGIGSNGAFWSPWPLKKGPTSGQSVW